MTRSTSERRAFLGVIASAGAFGALAFFATLALRANVDPLVFVSLRFTLATAVLSVIARGTARVSVKTSGRAVAIGAFVYAGQAITLTLALERSDTSVVAVLFGTYPLFVFLLLLPRRWRDVRAVFLVPLVGVVVGSTLLVGRGEEGNIDATAVVLALGSALLFATFVISCDALTPTVEPARLAWLCCIGAAASTSVLTLGLGRFDLNFDTSGWVWIAMAASISTAFAFTTLFSVLPALGPAVAAVALGAEPVASVALAALFLGDQLTAVQLGGAVLTIGSIVLLQYFLSGRDQGLRIQPPSRGKPRSG